MTRKEKIQFLRNVQTGKITLESPDLSKLTDDELRRIIEIQDRLKHSVSADLTEHERSFLSNLADALEERDTGFGLTTKQIIYPSDIPPSWQELSNAK